MPRSSPLASPSSPSSSMLPLPPPSSIILSVLSARAEGHSSFSRTRCTRAIRDATRRPCQISRWLIMAHSSRGSSAIRSRSMRMASVPRVSASRPVSRITWVSTVTPSLIPKALPSTTFAVFRPTPGSGRNSSIVRGTSPAWSAIRARARPTRWRALLRKNRVTNHVLHVGDARAGERCRVRPAAEQFGGHHVHPRVGALRAEDGGPDQLERICEGQLAMRVGIFVSQPAHDFQRPHPPGPDPLAGGPHDGLPWRHYRAAAVPLRRAAAKARKPSASRQLRMSAGPSPPLRAMPTP